jgi:hypothetical protein
VRAYSKGQKNDFRDAEAIAEAVQCPTMKFVATKTAWTEFRFIFDMARDSAGFHDSLLGVGWLRQAVGVAQTAAVAKPT